MTFDTESAQCPDCPLATCMPIIGHAGMWLCLNCHGWFFQIIRLDTD